MRLMWPVGPEARRVVKPAGIVDDQASSRCESRVHNELPQRLLKLGPEGLQVRLVGRIGFGNAPDAQWLRAGEQASGARSSCAGMAPPALLANPGARQPGDAHASSRNSHPQSTISVHGVSYPQKCHMQRITQRWDAHGQACVDSSIGRTLRRDVRSDDDAPGRPARRSHI